jgi:hypothetical protein
MVPFLKYTNLVLYFYRLMVQRLEHMPDKREVDSSNLSKSKVWNVAKRIKALVFDISIRRFKSFHSSCVHDRNKS